MSHMYFDDENEILEQARDWMEFFTVLHFNGNSFNKKIHRCLLDATGLIADNGHAALPPDFYAPGHNMMFDVLRINDSEVKKSYNPVKMRERKLHDEVMEKWGDKLTPNAEIIAISETNNFNEHTYKQYVKNAKRVIGEHIKKIPLWEKKWPDVKYKGLFICDETEVYFQGMSMLSGNPDPDHAWLRCIDLPCGLHQPWLDENFIRQIYESPIDFVIWFCPYKIYGVTKKIECDFPVVTIVDTRFYFDKYVAYPDTLVC